MNIELHDGKDPVLLRYKEGSFELCWKINSKDRDTGESVELWSPQKFYASPAQALSKLLTMKVGNSDATTLKELRVAIEKASNEIMEIYSTEITKEQANG